MAKNFEFRANVYGGTSNCQVRIVFFQWKDVSTSTIPSAGLVIHQATGDIPFNGIYNRDMIDAGTLRILADYRFPISNDASSYWNVKSLFFKTRKMAKRIQFNAGTTNEGSGKIYIYYTSTIDAGAADAAKPQMNFTSCLDFTDA